MNQSATRREGMNDLRCRLFGHRWGLWYSVGVWRCRECMRCGAIDEYRPRMSGVQRLGLRIGCAFEQFQTAVAAQLMPAFARLGEALRGINPPRSRLERAWDWFVEKCGASR